MMEEYQVRTFLGRIKEMWPSVMIDGEWLRQWSAVCSRFSLETMDAALDHHAQTSRYAPRPADLSKIAKQLTPAPTYEEKRDTRCDNCLWVMCVSRKPNEGFPNRVGWFLAVINPTSPASHDQAEKMRQNHQTMYRGKWEIFGPCSHSEIDDKSRHVKVDMKEKMI
jgi:hypothetical protein